MTPRQAPGVPIRRRRPDSSRGPEAVPTAPSVIYAPSLFEEIFRTFIDEEEISLAADGAEPLAALAYNREIDLRQRVVEEFWRYCRLPGTLYRILPSPRPRGYRTTSKRTVQIDGSTIRLTHVDGSGSAGTTPVESVLEPVEHGTIFRLFAQWLKRAENRLFGRDITYLIIRGSYEEFAVIFNVARQTPLLASALRTAVEEFRDGGVAISGAFLFYDPGRSRYYLDADRVSAQGQGQKLTGHENFRLDPGYGTLLASPFSFSQINLSITPELVALVKKLLVPDGNGRLLDLFCGWGLFSHALGSDYRQIVGVEGSRESVESATANIRRFKHSGRMAFRSGLISGETIDRLLPAYDSSMIESVILDPPRGGVDAELIEYLAARRVGRVVHIFCGIDEIPKALTQWDRCGYRVEAVIPVDMFPGTFSVETVVLLLPA